MYTKKTFAVVGGDLRNAHLANTLAEQDSDYKVYGMFLENGVKLSSRVHATNDVKLILPQSDIVIFPLPMLDAVGNINTPLDKGRLLLEECLDYIPPESIVLGGRVTTGVVAAAREKGFAVVDYLEREEFAILNAVPTAEGAVEIALQELPTTLFGSTCLITGYGRIAKVLTKLLLGFGAKVVVAARKHSDLAWIRVSGAIPVPISQLDQHLQEADILYNTVPAEILGEKKLTKLKRNCLVVDLASKPGGVDFETAKNLGLKTIWALSLPGKVAPISAGDIILRTVCNILGERGIL